ncbi:MAG: STAS-like domain-containing protein [Sulfobacillus sp.]|nr:STAS-like domain-containing protein [Sulfobacillus sp.]
MLDFRQIDVMTSAFADECFGKLWDAFDHQIIRRTIFLTGLSRNNFAMFRFVLRHR